MWPLKSAFARDWRNRHIAHRDLALVINEGAIPLAGASRKGVKDSLHAIAAVLNVLESHYCGSEVGYDVGFDHGNAETLLYVIRDGLDAEAEERARLHAGRLRPEDYRRKPPL